MTTGMPAIPYLYKGDYNKSSTTSGSVDRFACQIATKGIHACDEGTTLKRVFEKNNSHYINTHRSSNTIDHKRKPFKS